MSDNLSIRGGAPPPRLDRVGIEARTIPQARQTQPDGVPPPPTVEGGPSSIPVLALPSVGVDALGDVAGKFLALKLAIGDLQLSGSMKDIQDRGAVMKSKNEEIAHKLADAAKKEAEAEKAKTAMKVLGWIAVALSVVFAVATGGVGAIVAAAVGVTMAVLNETGVMEKLTDAIAKGLQEGPPPMDEATAKKTAGWIVMGISIAVSLTTVGVGIASGASQVAGLMQKLPEIATAVGGKLGATVTETTVRVMMEVAQKALTGARVAAGLVGVSQGVTGVIGGANRFAAADLQAGVIEDRAFLRRLQQKIEDEQDLVASIMEAMSDMTSRVIEVINGQSDSMNEVLHHMRPQMG